MNQTNEAAQGAAGNRYSPTNDEVYAEVCRQRGNVSMYVSTNAVNDVMAAVRALTIRAALKDQPAPAEAAQGEDSARPSAYTCIGKGGAYEVIGTALGAGTLKSSGRVRVYRDMASGELFYRTLRDFEARMEVIPGMPGTKEAES